MIDALSLPFFQRVLIAGLLASLACGVIGSFIVAKRMSSLVGGIAHAAFGGVGLGYWAGFSPLLGAAGVGVLASVAIGLAYRRLGSGLDNVVSLVWSFGMAMGVLFIALAPGYAPDLSSYLFGSLVFVPWRGLLLLAALDLAIVAIVFALFKELQAVSFDEEFAEVVGLPVDSLLLALLALAALAIVGMVRIVGLLLALALLTVPALIARQWTARLAPMMGLASAVAAGCTVAGSFTAFGLSQALDLSLPVGPVVIVFATVAYLISSALTRS